MAENPLLAAIDRAVDIMEKALDRALGMVIESAMDEGHLRNIIGYRDPDELMMSENGPAKLQALAVIFHKDDEPVACPLCLWIKHHVERKAKKGGV